MQLTDAILETMNQRRTAGERVTVLAAELGVPWQKLDKALRNGLSPRRPARQSASPASPAATGPLTERYRPRRLADVVGQPTACAFLRNLVTQPYPVALLFEGETGTGKSSAALALAADLGCAVEHDGFGGVHVIASGEQNADAVRATYDLMWQTPMLGSGWKVVIVNEADRISAAAETIWLDRLEALPPRTVVVFTTNYPARLSQRFRDRCVRLEFASDAEALRESARHLVDWIILGETGDVATAEMAHRLIGAATDQGRISFRRLLQAIQVELSTRKTPTPPVPKKRPEKKPPRPRRSLIGEVKARLRELGIPYVSLDDAKKAMFADSALKSFHYVVYSQDGENWLLWCGEPDEAIRQDMEQWAKVFGQGFRVVYALRRADGIIYRGAGGEVLALEDCLQRPQDAVTGNPGTAIDPEPSGHTPEPQIA